VVYLAGNIAVIRAFRTEFRDEFNFWRRLLIPAAAAVIFLFPLWGILRPAAYPVRSRGDRDRLGPRADRSRPVSSAERLGVHGASTLKFSSPRPLPAS